MKYGKILKVIIKKWKLSNTHLYNSKLEWFFSDIITSSMSMFILKTQHAVPAVFKHAAINTCVGLGCITIHMVAPETLSTLLVSSHVVGGKCLWFHTPLLRAKQTEDTEACFYRWSAQRGSTWTTCQGSVLDRTRDALWKYVWKWVRTLKISVCIMWSEVHCFFCRLESELLFRNRRVSHLIFKVITAPQSTVFLSKAHNTNP